MIHVQRIFSNRRHGWDQSTKPCGVAKGANKVGIDIAWRPLSNAHRLFDAYGVRGSGYGIPSR